MSEIRTATTDTEGARDDTARSPSMWLAVFSLTAFAVLIALGVWTRSRMGLGGMRLGPAPRT